jgi:hypothetical protein
MIMAKTTITKTAKQNDLKRAEKLMTVYAELHAEKEKMDAKHKAALETVVTSMKEAERELIEIGERNKKEFDDKDRLVLDDGYLLKSHSTSINPGKEFSWKKFFSKFPELCEFSFKVAPVKKLFMDADKRQALLDQDIDLKQNSKIVVKVNGNIE